MSEEGQVTSGRRVNDPIYRLLFHPTDEIEMDDGTRVPYVVLLLRNAREVLEKRYGPVFCNSQWIAHMWRVLLVDDPLRLTPQTSSIYVFLMLFIIGRERSIFDTMSRLYDGESLFGTRGPQQMFSFVHYHVLRVMELHMNHPSTNKYTVVKQMDDFVEEAQVQYVMGPIGAPRAKQQ